MSRPPYEWMDSYDEDVEPLENIGRALYAIARALHDLGTAGASTQMGAIEMLAKEVRDGFAGIGGLTPIAEAIDNIDGTLREGTLCVAVSGEVELSTVTAIGVELVRDET